MYLVLVNPELISLELHFLRWCETFFWKVEECKVDSQKIVKKMFLRRTKHDVIGRNDFLATKILLRKVILRLSCLQYCLKIAPNLLFCWMNSKEKIWWHPTYLLAELLFTVGMGKQVVIFTRRSRKVTVENINIAEFFFNSFTF